MMIQILKDAVAHSQVKNDPKPDFNKLNREFLNECTDFVNNIIDLKDSPWSTCDYVRWARTNTKIRLGSSQCTLIQFLQYRYFRKGQPCFVKQTYIAEQLKLDRTRINKMITALEKKGVIQKIQWLFKGRRKNTVLLPLVPSISKYFQEKNLPDADFQSYHVQCGSLFCKSLNSKEIPRSLLYYTNIIYINNLFNNTKVNNNSIKISINNIIFDYSLSKKKKGNSNLKIVESKCVDSKEKGESALNKFLLKRKQIPFGSAYRNIFETLKNKHNYEIDYLDAKDRNDLITFIDHYYFIDINSHFKIPQNINNNKKSFYYNHAKELRRKLIQIICDGHSLKWDWAERFMVKWNEAAKLDKHLTKVNVNNKETKSFINNVIAFTHCLIYKSKQNASSMFKIPERLKIARNFKKPPFTWKSKISIDKFLINNTTYVKSDFLSAFIGSDFIFNQWLYKAKIYKRHEERVENGFSEFRDKFVDTFWNGNKNAGYNICDQYQGIIKKWLQKRIIEIVDNKGRKLYGYSLVFERLDPETRMPLAPLIDLLFYYAKQKYGWKVNLVTLLNDDLWDDFIENHMKASIGLNDFYEIDKHRGRRKNAANGR